MLQNCQLGLIVKCLARLNLLVEKLIKDIQNLETAQVVQDAWYDTLLAQV